MAGFSEHRRFLALRACWTILRGGSVAWRLDVTEDGFRGLRTPTFIAGCHVDGEPATPWDIHLGGPDPQP